MPWIVASAVLLVLVAATLFYLPVLRGNRNLMETKAELQRKIEREKTKAMLLENELTALQNDPYYIERMARDILKYGRVGEVIFKFPEDLSNSEPPPGSSNGASTP